MLKAHHEIIEPDYTTKIADGFKEHYFHWHKRMEMIYLFDGECGLETGGNNYNLKKGDVAFIHSGEIHRLSSENDKPVMAYICTFNPSLLHQLKTERVYVNNHIPSKILISKGIDKDVRRCFEEIFDEDDSDGFMKDSIIMSDIIRLYSLFGRYFENKNMTERKSLPGIDAFDSAIEYISENFTENITLKSLSEKINYCPSYISTMFVTHTGVNFKTYLDIIRVKRASDLIKNTDEKISNIAYECGFVNLKTFNNTFKRITGNSPGEFRKNSI